MKSVERADGAGDPTRDRECYRCDRHVAPARLFRVTVKPLDILSNQYRTAVRFCCPHCAAAMNLSEFSERWKKHARRE